MLSLLPRDSWNLSLNKEALLQVPGDKGIPEYPLFTTAMLHRFRKRKFNSSSHATQEGTCSTASFQWPDEDDKKDVYSPSEVL